MALPFTVESLDNVAEGFREHYEPDGAGKFRLNVDGLPAQEDVTGLKSANARLKEEAKESRAFAAVARELGIKNADDLRPLATAANSLGTLKIEHEIQLELLKARVTPEGLQLLPEALAKRVKIEGGKVKVLTSTGKQMTGTDDHGLATIRDLIQEATKTYGLLFTGSGIGGSGAPPSRRPSNDGTMSRAAFDRLPPAERHGVVRRGTKIID